MGIGVSVLAVWIASGLTGTTYWKGMTGGGARIGSMDTAAAAVEPSAQDPGAPPPFDPGDPGGPPPFNPGDPPPGDPGGPPPFGPGGPGGFGGGPGGGPGGGDLEIVKQYDKDGDGRLNWDERTAARAALRSSQAGMGGGRGRGFGPRGGDPGGGQGGQAPKPGPRVDPNDVKSYPAVPLYDPSVLRTLFFDFEDADWEAQLSDFNRTDVEVPATLTVDGKRYEGVGMGFRGNTSNMGGVGVKRPLNVSINFTKKDQRLYGYKSLNLLNAHEDPSFLRTILYSRIARQYIPAPNANLVKVVINGESWGVYVNAQQVDSKFMEDWFGSRKGARWKIEGNPGGGGGLDYRGESLDDYRRSYQLKSEEKEDVWKKLIALCRTLNGTPEEKLEEALKPMLDIDGALRFLALDNVLMNNDGYWIRASDYYLILDEKGVFHVVPHDLNESMGAAGMGPGMGRGFGGGGMTAYGLDPLVGLEDESKPLRSRLLAVPALRDRYLGFMAEIAEVWLDWKRLKPIVDEYRSLIEKEVEADTHKLASFEEFQAAVSDAPPAATAGSVPGRRSGSSLRAFAEGRRSFLLVEEDPEGGSDVAAK